jgi:hypothetical protein
MSKLSVETKHKLSAYKEIEGAQELIDAHLDDVNGGGWGFTLFGQFQQGSPSPTPAPKPPAPPPVVTRTVS